MKWRVALLTLALAVLGFWGAKMVWADEDCLSNPENWPPLKLSTCLTELNNLKALSEAATAPLESEVKNLGNRIAALQAGINSAVAKQKKLALEVADREEKVAEHYVLFGKKVRELYKSLRGSSLLVQVLSTVGAGKINREIAYQGTASNVDKQLIIGLSGEIVSLEKDKKRLEDQNTKLASLQETLNKQAEFYKGEVAKAKAYQSNLAGQISSLQAAILAAKSGTFITSVGDSELADDYNASIKGFRESAPSGSFAVFAFGAYTHRKGMSQYGARGRAQNGQNYQQILKVYYGKEAVSKDTGGSISVSGYGDIDFETKYLYGIAEMPSTWHPEALKAQAIAARTYAYRYKVEDKTICATETCQVFRKSKADNPPDAWKQAVDQTRGQVLEDVVTYYSSTAGSYSFTSGWDTTDGGGGGNFFDKSYEKLGGSPWGYKAWYRQGYTSSGATCGKGDPWLTNEQLTDLVNAAIVLKNGSDSRVIPVLASCWKQGDPYSYADLRSKGGVSSVTSVVVTQGNGETNEVVINGSIHLTGSEFKKGFNLRAPGYLRIPQGLTFGSSVDFEFFNIEKK